MEAETGNADVSTSMLEEMASNCDAKSRDDKRMAATPYSPKDVPVRLELQHALGRITVREAGDVPGFRARRRI